MVSYTVQLKFCNIFINNKNIADNSVTFASPLRDVWLAYAQAVACII